MLPQRAGFQGGYLLSPRVGGATTGIIEEAVQSQGGDMFTNGVRTIVDEMQVPVQGSLVTGVYSPVAGVVAMPTSPVVAAMPQASGPKALSQRELEQAISSGVVAGIARLGLMEKHTEVLEAVTKVTVEPPDFSPVMKGLSQLLTLRDSHSEVLEAITNVTVEQPDLSPIMRQISQLASLQDGHKEVMEAITNIVVEPPDLTPIQQMMQELRADMRSAIDGFRKEMQDDLGVLQQELLKNREETRNDAEVLLQELQSVPRDIDDMRKELKKLDKRSESDHSEVMRALGDLAAVELDAVGLAGAVHDRLLRAKLRVDNSDVLQALKNLELDQPALATLITDKMRKHTFAVDNSEVIGAIRRLPEVEAISRSVHDRMMKNVPDKNDYAELLDTVRRIKREPDFSPIIAALNSSEVDLSPVLEAIGRIKLDNGPVLDAVRRIDSPDVETIGRVVGDRIRRANVATRDELAELLGAVRKIPDNAEVLDALRGLEAALDLGLVMDGIKGISFPDHHTIAGTVYDKIKRGGLQVDHSEALAGIRLAIGEAGRFDMGALLQEISKITLVQSDHTDILRAVANVQLDIRALRETFSVQRQVVQTQAVVPQQPQIVKQIVQPPRQVVVSGTLSPEVMQQRALPLGTTNIETVAMKDNLSPRVVAEVYGPKVELRPTTTTMQTIGPSVVTPTASAANLWTAATTSGVAKEVVATEFLVEDRETSLTPRRPVSMLTTGGFSPEQSAFVQETIEQDELISSRPVSRMRSGSRARFPGAAAI